MAFYLWTLEEMPCFFHLTHSIWEQISEFEAVAGILQQVRCCWLSLWAGSSLRGERKELKAQLVYETMKNVAAAAEAEWDNWAEPLSWATTCFSLFFFSGADIWLLNFGSVNKRNFILMWFNTVVWYTIIKKKLRWLLYSFINKKLLSIVPNIQLAINILKWLRE